MRHNKRGRKLSRKTAHRKALMSNLAVALITHKKIKTTDAKAKELTYVEISLITFAKRGDLHARRQVLKKNPGIKMLCVNYLITLVHHFLIVMVDILV